MKRLFLVLALVAMVFGGVPKAEAYSDVKISHLATEHVLELEFSSNRSGFTVLVKTQDGKVTEHNLSIVSWVGVYLAWLDLPNEEVEVSFYEPVWLSESWWKDHDGDGWFSWQGGRLQAILSCANGKPKIQIDGQHMDMSTWLVVSGLGMNGWPIMYNGGGGPFTSGVFERYLTNVKTSQVHEMVQETLDFTVYAGTYEQISDVYLSSVRVLVPATCPAVLPFKLYFPLIMG